MRLSFSLGRSDTRGPSKEERLTWVNSCALISQSRVSLFSGRQLIGDTIELFDEALARLDKNSDREARKMIDLLALSVVNRIREHVGPSSTLELAPKYCNLCRGVGCPLQVGIGESGRSEESLSPGSGFDAKS